MRNNKGSRTGNRDERKGMTNREGTSGIGNREERKRDELYKIAKF
jgi:hypothetical protein